MQPQSDDIFETTDQPSHPVGGATFARADFASGRYQVQRLLGEGGQKQVFLARDTRLDRQVVISLLKTEQLDETSVARLWREAQAMGRLGAHPNIVTVYDVAEEAGRPYIVSQYVEGGSIADLIRHCGRRPLPIDRVLKFSIELCRALEYAHGRGFVHRDLKPANIWLTEDGSVKLGDFGLALSLHFSQITLEGAVVGTVAYMAPEQALGHKVEPRSDLYALGVVLYEMVTGRPPFQGDQFLAVISQHIYTAPVSPSWHNPELPQPLESLILQLLAKDPEQRPASAAVVRQILETITLAEPAVAAAPVRPDTRSLNRLAGGIFVGREKTMSQLRAALNDAISGRGRLLLLTAEPGGGKTRTTEQLATYARLREAQVLLGRCYEGEGAPAFWPWVQIIRSYVQEQPPASLISIMGGLAGDIGQVVSEVRVRLPNIPAPPLLEPEQARFRLFDSITIFLRNASKAQALVLVLDDLQWADKPSLLLLEFLAREMRDARLLVLGTYRDMELGRNHPLAQTLAELASQSLADRILLPGLTEQDVARFIELTSGATPPEKLVSAVHTQSEGNPFFVTEIVRLLVSEGRLEQLDPQSQWSVPIPQSVREVVGRRLDHLSEDCRKVLTIAAVLGRDFSLNVLEPLVDVRGDGLLDLLDEAVAARIVLELPKAPGQYTFSHALVREALYDGLSANRRVRLHRRVGELLEALYRSSPDAHLPALAHHFFQAAGAGGDVEKAIHYATRAAERANLLLAYEEAAGHYQRAIQAVDLLPHPDPERRCDLLLALGGSLRKAGGSTRAKEYFEQAVALARQLKSAEKLARAALGMAGAAMGLRYGAVDQAQVALLEEALAALGDQENALRARVMAQLALAVYHIPDRRLPLSQQAVETARLVGDPSALIAALYSRSISLEGFEASDERLAVATEIIEVARRAGSKEMALRGHFRRIREYLERADLAAMDDEINTYNRIAEELRQPVYLWLAPFYRSSRALLEGRFDDCEKLALQALSIGQRAQDPNAQLFFYTQLVTLRGRQGRLAEVCDSVRGFVEKYPSIVGWRATLAYIYGEIERPEEARTELDRLAANDFRDFPRDGAWVVGLALLAQVCHVLGDRERAATIYDLLLPFAGHIIAIGSAAVFYGPVDRQLGLLAATLSRWDDATRHFEAAIECMARLGSRPFLAYCQFEYGAALLGQGRSPGNLMDQALHTATELGMQKLAADISRQARIS